MIAQALLAMLLAGGSGPASVKKPRVVLTAYPKIVMWRPYDRKPVRLELKVYDADERLWCPEVEWHIPDGTVDREQSDCEPYDQADPVDIAVQSWSRWIPSPPPGSWKIFVLLKKYGAAIRRGEAYVEVTQ